MSRGGVGKRRPIFQQRSRWVEQFTSAEILTQLPDTTTWQRRVGDGLLQAFVSPEPHGLHMSISFHDAKMRPSRYPSWDEIADARDALLPGDKVFAMVLPREEHYVAHHPTTFHLHELTHEFVDLYDEGLDD